MTATILSLLVSTSLAHTPSTRPQVATAGLTPENFAKHKSVIVTGMKNTLTEVKLQLECISKPGSGSQGSCEAPKRKLVANLTQQMRMQEFYVACMTAAPTLAEFQACLNKTKK